MKFPLDLSCGILCGGFLVVSFGRVVGRGEELRCDKRAVVFPCSKVVVLYKHMCFHSRRFLQSWLVVEKTGTVPKFEIPRNYFLNHKGFYPPEVILGHGRVGV